VESKSIFLSKTFWTNLIAILAMVVQHVAGKELIDLEVQASILAFINIILRVVTKQSIAW